MEDGFLLDEFNEEQLESLLDNAADQLPVSISHLSLYFLRFLSLIESFIILNIFYFS